MGPIDVSKWPEGMAGVQRRMAKNLADMDPEEAKRQEQAYQREKAARQAREYAQAKARIQAERAKHERMRADWQLHQMKQNLADGLIPLRTSSGAPVQRQWFLQQIMMDVPFLRFEQVATYGDTAVRIATQSYLDKKERGVRFRNPVSYIIACCERVQIGKHFTWVPEYEVTRDGRWHDRVSLDELKAAIGIGLTVEDDDEESDLLTALPMAQKMSGTRPDLSKYTQSARNDE